MDRDITYFEQEAIWAADLHAGERDCIALIERFWPRDARTMLDAGAGAGRLLNNLKIPAKTWACDLSVTALRKLRTSSAAAARVTSLPFRDGAFDLTLCSNVLEHLSNEDLQVAFAELMRVSAKYVLIVSPINEPMRTQLTTCRSCGCQFHPNGHRRSFAIADFEKAMPGFETQTVSFFAEPFLVTSPLAAAAERALGNDIHAFVGALCPNCGWVAGEAPAARPQGAGLWDLGLQPGDPSDAALRLPSSALILLRRTDSVETGLPPEAPACLRLRTSSPGAATATFSERHPGVVDFATRLEAIGPATDGACLVTETGTAWRFNESGAPSLEPGEDKDRYALFLAPAAQVLAADSVALRYSGETQAGILLELYDTVSGYVPLGLFAAPDETAVDAPRTARLSLPALVRPGGLLAIFRLFLPRGDDGKVVFQGIALEPLEEVAPMEVSFDDAHICLPVADLARRFSGSFTVASEQPVAVMADARLFGCRTGAIWIGEDKAVAIPAWLRPAATVASERSEDELRATFRLGEDLRRLLCGPRREKPSPDGIWPLVVEALARISGLPAEDIRRRLERPLPVVPAADDAGRGEITRLLEALNRADQSAQAARSRQTQDEPPAAEPDATVDDLAAEIERLVGQANAIAVRRAEAETALTEYDATIAGLSAECERLTERLRNVS